jgi:hypothetical protein
MLSGHQLDYREIARQNKITEQILQNYLEKRLFPNNHRPSKAPTVWDILPRARRKPNNNIQDVLNTTHETLESGESERVSFFDDDKTKEDEEFEGMLFFYLFPLIDDGVRSIQIINHEGLFFGNQSKRWSRSSKIRKHKRHA